MVLATFQALVPSCLCVKTVAMFAHSSPLASSIVPLSTLVQTPRHLYVLGRKTEENVPPRKAQSIPGDSACPQDNHLSIL